MTAMHTPALHPALDAPIESWRHGASGNLRYYRSECDSGRPLVLIHSVNAAASAMEIEPLFEHYRHQRPVFAPDLPGFGLSQRGRLPYSPDFFAGVLAAFLQEVVGEPADVVALSLSAEFAARASLQVPDSCHSLTLISPTGLGQRQPPGPDTTQRIKRFLQLPALGSGLYRVLTTRPSIRYFLEKSFDGEVPEQLVDYAWHTARARGARHAPFAFLSMGLFTSDAATNLYRPLEVPTLILYDRDPNVSFDRLPELLEANPNVEALRLGPSCGLPHWEHTARCCEALDAFWRSAGEATEPESMHHG
jgi:pimeloyl-ACP methyl ester carboxylesterase